MVEPDEEEMAFGWEHCTKCGCCERNEHSNCTCCGHPHNGSIEVLGDFPQNWTDWIDIVGSPTIGDRFRFQNFAYTVIESEEGKVRLDRPLDDSINGIGEIL